MKWTKKNIMTTIMQKVDEKLQFVACGAGRTLCLSR